MNYQQARIFCISAVIIIILLCVGGLMRCARGSDEPSESADNISTTQSPKVSLPSPEVPLKVSPKVGNLATMFNDLNDVHLRYAASLGIRPIESTRDIMRINRPVVELKSCEYYSLDNLTHSYPYLVEPAAELLDTIGARFNSKLRQQNGGDYRIKVTSLLRTRESVNRLKRGNVNSTENSAHLYGTTFDISYTEFVEEFGNKIKHNDGSLKNLLAEVIMELRQEGKCLVKYERKQGCFHITSTGH